MMQESDIEIIRRALYDALSYRTYAQEDSKEKARLIKDFSEMLRDLSTTTWELWIWKGGELYTGHVDSDPNAVLEWAVNYAAPNRTVEGLTPAEAFDHVREEYNNMDISFTVVKKFRGDICVFEQENAEFALVKAAKAMEQTNART